MLFDSAHTDELKAWLATELEPICDADPEVLSDYVMALLRRDVADSELAKSMREQLIDFLEAETKPFVDRVFAALSSKSYLPESARQPPAPTTTTTTTPSSSNPTSNLPSNPLNSTDNSRKRKPEEDANDTSPKISKILTLDESIKAQSSLPSHPGNRGHASFHKTDGGRPPLGTNVIWGQGDIQLKKGQCIDYHLKGFCSRGDSCQYEHAPNLLGGNKQSSNGSNPFVSSMSGGGIRMGASSPTPGSSFGNGLPNTPGNFNPRNGRTASPAGGGGGMNNGDSELASRMGVRSRPPHQIQHQQQHHHHQPPFPFQQPQQPMHMMMGGGPPPMQNGMPPQGMMFPQQGMPPGGFDGSGAWRGGMSGGGGGNHNSRGGSSNRGRGGGTGQFRNQGQKSDTTLVLENVPSENLDLVQVNEYFKKFGTITNIQIDAPNKKALVSFAKPSQATEAHSSPEVIFGNRFVKCYFQRLDDASQPFHQQQHQQHQQPPQQQQQPKIPHGAVAPPPKSSFIPGQTSHVYVAPGASVPSSSTANGASSSNAEEKKKLIQERDSKQKELESLLNEQKSLFTKIGAATSAEEKKSVMTRLRSLDKETKELKDKVQKAIDSVNNFKEVSSTVTSKYQQEEEKKKELREQKERARLDRELDLHAQAPKDGSSKEEELKETLRKLQAEATSIGLDSNGNPTSSTSSRGGRGGFRGGRGGSMRLDNRTTRLSVKGLKKEDEGKREQLKEHFKQFGDVESFEDEPSDENSEEAPGLIVVYKARPSGEAALRQGNEIPEIGQVKLSWSNAPSLPNSQTPTSSQSNQNNQEEQSNGKKDEE